MAVTGHTAFLDTLTQIKQVVQGHALNVLRDAVQGAVTIEQAVRSLTGDAFEALVAAATVGLVVPPTITISSAVIGETDATVEFTVAISGEVHRPVALKYATANGTATEAGRDYESTSGSLTWEAGDQSAKVVRVNVTDDALFEADEYFAMILSNASNAVIESAVAYARIVDDDDLQLTLPSTTEQNEVLIETSSDSLALIVNGIPQAYSDRTQSTKITVLGSDSTKDVLEIDASQPRLRGDSVRYIAGDLEDQLVVTGGNFERVMHSFQGGESETSLEPYEGNVIPRIHTQGVDNFLLHFGDANTLRFEFGPHVTQVILEDADLSDSAPHLASKLRIRSPDAAFASTTFSSSIGHLEFVGDFGEKGLTVESVDPQFEATLEVIAKTVAGDANGDGAANFADFLILSSNFGRTDNVQLSEGDFDRNGAIDFADFLILSSNFGNQ